MIKPNTINILGKDYSIQYVDNPSEVDIWQRHSAWGQIDFWTRSIRVYDHGRSAQDILHTLLHEVLHGIILQMHMEEEKLDDETAVDVLSLALADVLTRNEWLKSGEEA